LFITTCIEKQCTQPLSYSLSNAFSKQHGQRLYVLVFGPTVRLPLYPWNSHVMPLFQLMEQVQAACLYIVMSLTRLVFKTVLCDSEVK